MRWAVGGSAVVLAAATLSACGGPAVDASCDLEGVTQEVEHVLHESSLHLEEVTELACTSDWSVVRISASEEGKKKLVPQEFIFKHEDIGLVFKAPETVCGNENEARQVPEALAEMACPAN